MQIRRRLGFALAAAATIAGVIGCTSGQDVVSPPSGFTSTSPMVSTGRTSTAASPTTTEALQPSSTSATPSQASAPPSGPERYSQSVAPAVTDSAHVEAARQALDTFRGFMVTWDSSFEDPSGQDWSTVMSQYSSGDAYELWRSGWQAAVEARIRTVGVGTGTASVPLVVSVDVVDIRACFPVVERYGVDEAGNRLEQVDPPEGLTEFAWLMQASWIENRWLITSLVQAQPSGEPLPCS